MDEDNFKPDEMIRFPVAEELLKRRFPDTTLAEIAMWCLLDKKGGGLSSYETNPTTEHKSDTSFRYAFLLGRKFKREEIEKFKPESRWIDYEALLARWSAKMGPQRAAAQIQDFYNRCELDPLDPCIGIAESVESAVFLMAQIEALEKEIFPQEIPSNEEVTAKGITKEEVLTAFEKLVKNKINLKKALADGKGIFGENSPGSARVRKGSRGGRHKALWNPVILALGLHEQYSVPFFHLKRVFTDHKFLRDWTAEWHEALDRLGE